MTSPLTPDMAAATAFADIGAACMHHFETHRAVLALHEDIEAVHKARIEIRRLRAAMSLFRPIVRGRPYGEIKVELHWLSKQLGRVRDLDVVQAVHFKTADPEIRASSNSRELAAAIEVKRIEAHRRFAKATASGRFACLKKVFASWLTHCALPRANLDKALAKRDRPVGPFLAGALERRRKKFAIVVGDINHLNAPALHRLRIRAKKLRYMMEFCEPLITDPGARKRLGYFTKAMNKMQGALGEIQDGRANMKLLRKIRREVIARRVHSPRHSATIQTAIDRANRKPRLRDARKQARKALAIKSFWTSF
jgi:triphosphatase